MCDISMTPSSTDGRHPSPALQGQSYFTLTINTVANSLLHTAQGGNLKVKTAEGLGTQLEPHGKWVEAKV